MHDSPPCALRSARLKSCRTLYLAVISGLAAFLCACAALAPANQGAPQRERRAVEASIEALYRAFCFDPGGEPDWAAMRELFVDGAVFVAPFAPAEQPRAVGVEPFFADFRAFAASDAVRDTGLHELILRSRVELYGVIAHAFVAFEGFEPRTGKLRTRGLDSIQLLLDRGRWRLVSFTTQYAGPDAPLPERFLVE